jgi:hypothetical protein
MTLSSSAASSCAGLITAVMIVVQLRLGKVWTRYGKIIYRDEEPKSFYTSIMLQVLFVVIFFGMAIYQYNHPPRRTSPANSSAATTP